MNKREDGGRAACFPAHAAWLMWGEMFGWWRVCAESRWSLIRGKPFCSPPCLDQEAKWCEAGSSLTSSITPPQPIPLACLSGKRWWGGCWGVVGRSKRVEWSGVSFIYQLRMLFCSFVMKALKVVNSASLAWLFSALRGRFAVDLLMRDRWVGGRSRQAELCLG